MRRFALELVARHFACLPAPLPGVARTVLLKQSDTEGEAQARERIEALVGAALQDGCVSDAMVAESLAQYRALWQVRESTPLAQAEEGLNIKHDISGPVSAIPDVVARTVAAVLAMKTATDPAWPPVLHAAPYRALKRPALLARLPVLALTLSLAWATPARAAGDELYQALGAKPGLVALMDDFVPRLKADARIASFFKDTKATHLSQQLVDQVCVASGGPCVYEGAPMLDSHRELQITKADFNALVEVLQHSMHARGIPFATQNRLLALLAPLHREIVTR